MNEWLAGLIGGAVAGAFILILQAIPLSPNYQDGEFRRHLNRTEKAQLEAGQVIEKNHRAFTTIWRKSYNEGLLRVEKTPEKKLRFTPHGKWHTVEADGRVSSVWEYTGFEREAVYAYYQPSGALDMVIYNVPAVLNGDSVREERVVYFRYDKPTDTAAVQHFYRKHGKPLKKVAWSYDARGLRPVPPGWHLTRY